LYLANDRQHVGRVTVRLGLYCAYSDFPRLGKLGTSELHAASLGPRQCVSRPRGDHRALFLGKRCEQVQDKRINVHPKLGNDELHALSHEAGDEVYVAAEAVELRHGNGTTAAAGLCEGSGKLWSAAKGVGTLAALDLYKLADSLKALGRRKALKGLALRLDPEPGAALVCRGYPDVGAKKGSIE
jgi:hypothetical protein